MSRIKILVDAHVFDGEFQGSRTFIENIYKALINKYSDKFQFYFAAHNIGTLKIIFGDGNEYLQLKSTNKYSRLLFEYPSLIKQNKIDWAHFQYISPLFKACKYIVTCHDVLFERFPQYFPLSYRLSKHLLFKRSAKNSDLLTTVSRYSKNEIAHFYKINKKDIHITFNGVNNVEVLKTDKPDEAYLLYVSRIEPRKNHHMLLAAMKNLGLFEKGYKLIIVGKESIANTTFNSLKKEILRVHPGSIIIKENISEEEKNNLIDACCLFVYPSSAEGFGIPPLEAALRMKPVICSNKTSMREYDFFGEGHINPENQSELQETILGFLNGHIKTDLGAIAEQIESKYSWDKSADSLAGLILNFNS
ncbi:glycosyltransferase family 4 protein [Hyphobacterium sp. CCMP332]|nr:glycosyltransferase family 4 protein [Hyphobacterium sp. CCMP332]